jgi:glycosyltransferase involved in cell wall biosynthesis
LSKKNSIAIYSGSIPSTTFIENLIDGISKNHKVFLFGKLKSKPTYNSNNIKVYPIYDGVLKNMLITLLRVLKLCFLHPSRLKIVYNQLKKFKGIRSKWNWFTRYAPVVLHLPTIFHIQWAKDVQYWMFLKEEFGLKMVLSLRGAHINYSPLADKVLANSYRKHFPKIDAFHAVSEAIGLEAQKYGANPSKIKVIHSLVSASTLNRFMVPEQRNVGVLKIISVGRHHWKKGYAIALEACKILNDQEIPFNYTIIAAGNIPEELIFQRHQLGLKDRVHFLDAMPQEEVFEAMQNSDVLLLPSLEEGIANVVLEAMAIGVPVISTDCGGMNEVVKNKETGWLVSTLDSHNILNAITDYRNTSFEKRNKMIYSAHELVKNKFNQEKSIEKFNQLYRKLN